MEERPVETLNVYIRETRYEGVYDVHIPELVEEVFEVTGSYYVIPLIENCVQAIMGTDRFNLQFFAKADILSSITMEIFDE